MVDIPKTAKFMEDMTLIGRISNSSWANEKLNIRKAKINAVGVRLGKYG